MHEAREDGQVNHRSVNSASHLSLLINISMCTDEQSKGKRKASSPDISDHGDAKRLCKSPSVSTPSVVGVFLIFCLCTSPPMITCSIVIPIHEGHRVRGVLPIHDEHSTSSRISYQDSNNITCPHRPGGHPTLPTFDHLFLLLPHHPKYLRHSQTCSSTKRRTCARSNRSIMKVSRRYSTPGNDMRARRSVWQRPGSRSTRLRDG